nr:viral peptide [Bearded dragon adenovirus 1]
MGHLNVEVGVPAVAQQLGAVLQARVPVMVERIFVIHHVQGPTGADVGPGVDDVRIGKAPVHVTIGAGVGG